MAKKLGSGRNGPRVDWDGEELMVSVPIPPDLARSIRRGGAGRNDEGLRVDCRWKPGALTAVRIRRLGETSWSPAFQTPLNSVQFSGLEPDTEYEVQITQKSQAGEGPAAVSRAKTDPTGRMGNVVPFRRPD